MNADATMVWSYSMPYGPSGVAWLDSAPAILSGGYVYFGCKDGGAGYGSAFYALASTGSLWWSYKPGGGVDASSTMGFNDELYFGAAGKLYALDYDGALRWSYTAGMMRSSPAVWSGDGSIAGIGDALYLMNSDGTLYWSYLGAGGNHSPSFDNNKLYTGSAEGNGNSYAFNSNGTLQWSYMTIMGAYCDAVTADESSGRIYACSILPQASGTPCPQKLYVLGESGALEWSYRMGDRPDSILMGAIALDADGRIYHGSVDSKLYAWNSNGTLLWSYRGGYVNQYSFIQGGPALSSDGKLYISDGAGVFYSFGPTATPTPTRR